VRTGKECVFPASAVEGSRALLVSRNCEFQAKELEVRFTDQLVNISKLVTGELGTGIVKPRISRGS
jgi:hypothetical protein